MTLQELEDIKFLVQNVDSDDVILQAQTNRRDQNSRYLIARCKLLLQEHGCTGTDPCTKDECDVATQLTAVLGPREYEKVFNYTPPKDETA